MTKTPKITERPVSLNTETTKVKNGCGTFFITLSKDPDCFEVDLHLGKSGSCQQAFLEAIRGLLTICRRNVNPIPRALIVKQLEGIRCPTDSAFFKSCPAAICEILKQEWNIKDEEETEP